MLYLNSNRLRVEIALPGEAPNVTTRFDRAGFITEVTLDGVHRFCASEPNNLPHPSSGGRGLCCEYQFDPSAEAAVGGKFPKLGVGLLTKESEKPYRFPVKYEAEPYKTAVDAGESSAVFTTEPRDCMGYSVSQIKTAAVNENELTVSVRLTNTGEKPIEGREYCHNFISLNGMALTPDYRLDFEDVEDLGGIRNGQLICEGKAITLGGYQPKPSMVTVPEEKLIPAGGVFRWEMSNPAAGVRVSVRDEIAICGLAVWSADHIVSVESFHKLSLKPGETSEWKRTWRFDEY